MPFEVFTHNRLLAKELRDSAPSGVSTSVGRTHDDPGWIVITLEFVRDTAFAVDIHLFAAWLCTKCKDQDCRIKHEGKTVPPEEVVIRRIASEDLETGETD